MEIGKSIFIGRERLASVYTALGDVTGNVRKYTSRSSRHRRAFYTQVEK
jgi:hypothetical protein